MKAIIFGLALVSTAAHASWFQEYCSSADGSVRIAQGHNENEIKVTERKISKDGSVKSRLVILKDAFMTPIVTQELEHESEQDCNAQWGFSSWRSVRYQTVHIERPDGPAFSKDIVGLSEDGRFIEAKVLCEEKGNSEIFCAKPVNGDPLLGDRPAAN